MMNDKKHLVFLPGWSYQSSVWEIAADRFTNHHTHLFDLSDADENNFADSLPEKSTLIGWSFGGLIAISLCSRFPEKFDRLILTGSSPKFMADDNWIGIEKDNAEKFLLTAQQDMKKLLKDFHKLVSFPNVSREYLRYLTTNTQKHLPVVYFLRRLLHTDFRKQYHSLQLPTLSIAGERDAVLPPKKTDYIIPGAGHAAFLTHTDQFVKIVNHFLEDK